MRSDMPRVLVERPRWGSSLRNTDVCVGRHVVRRARDADALAALERRSPMQPRRGPWKHLNENLAPLLRFLRSQVGRPWDNVYGELRASLSPRSTMDMHIMEHLWQFVERHVEIREGELHARDGRPLWRGGRELYVDPASGRLRVLPRRSRRRQPPPDTRRIVRDDGLLYLELDEQWYAVQTAPVLAALAMDVVLRAPADGTTASERARLYGDPRRYAVSKRQLSRKALRDAGLR